MWQRVALRSALRLCRNHSWVQLAGCARLIDLMGKSQKWGRLRGRSGTRMHHSSMAFSYSWHRRKLGKSRMKTVVGGRAKGRKALEVLLNASLTLESSG